MWTLAVTLAILFVSCEAQYGRYGNYYSGYSYPREQRYRQPAYAPRREYHQPMYYEEDHYAPGTYEPQPQSRPVMPQYEQRQRQPHPVEYRPEPPAPRRDPPQPQAYPQPDSQTETRQFTYEETSYGQNPLSELDPYTRKAVEETYGERREVRGGERGQVRGGRGGRGRGRGRPRAEKPRADARPRKQYRKPVEEPEGSGEADCSMMKNPKGMMDSAMMKEGCRSYKAWGESMKEPMKWKPTDGQMAWWKSLSMPMDERKAYMSSRRHKRQAVSSLRKEYRALTDQERQAFHNAVRGLKSSSMDGTTMYDVFVGFHQSQMAPAAHFGPVFYSWHRELLYRFERALQTIDPSVTVPYYASNLDNHLGSQLAMQSVTWTADFAGNGDGIVRTGPFADWTLASPVQNQRFLYRNLGLVSSNLTVERIRTPPALMSDEALATILNAQRYRDVTWFVDSSFETFHGATHNWVGGLMTNLPNSPNDPMFFLHHAFIDCLFTWMRNNQRARGIDVQYDYPNDTQALGVGMRRQGDGRLIQRPEDSFHYALAEMRPFGPLRNIDGLSDFYEEVSQCDSYPTCSRSDTSCGGSGYLFCDESAYRCAPKLRLGAQCQRFSRYSPCSGGECCNGVCRASCGNRRRQNRPGQDQRDNQAPNRRANTRRRDQNTRNPEPDRSRTDENTSRDRRPNVVETMHGTENDQFATSATDVSPGDHFGVSDQQFTRPDEPRQDRVQIQQQVHDEGLPPSEPDNNNHRNFEEEQFETANLSPQQPRPAEQDPRPQQNFPERQPPQENRPRQNFPHTNENSQERPPSQDQHNSNSGRVVEFGPAEEIPRHTFEEPPRQPERQPNRFHEQPETPRNVDRVEHPQETRPESNNENIVHGLPDAYLPHPGVPTHAPYVVPKLPPVPTHAPYVVPQVPTHPPGYGAIQPAPTHAPSLFQDHREEVVSQEVHQTNQRLYDDTK